MPGKFRPTIAHSFVKILADRGLLGMCFTQNIDTLERIAGVPEDLILEAHGSFASQHCIDCQAIYDGKKLKEQIQKEIVARCDNCGGLVKPDIVFFGESLPPRFHTTVPLLRSADLLIVMGTSLTVHPFATLAGMVPEGCPRVLMNMDLVGDFGSDSDDVIALGKTDDVVRNLCKELGWDKELEAAWAATENLVAGFGSPPPTAARDGAKKIADAVERSLQSLEGKPEVETVSKKDVAEPVAAPPVANADDEVEKLTNALETTLRVSQTESDNAERASTKEDADEKTEQKL